MQPESEQASQGPAPRRRPAARFRRAAWISGLLTAMLTAAVIFISRGRIEAIDEARLAEVKQLWQQAQIDDYDLHLHVTNRQRDTYQIRVRGGQVSAILLNGNPLSSRHSFPAWSVEGMLETISRDLVSIRRYQQGERGPDVCNLYIRGQFHPEFGYPEKYIRMPRGGQAQQPSISWELVDFSRHDPEIANSGPED